MNARAIVEVWRRGYNEERIKRYLEGITLAAYAKSLIQTS